MVSADFIGRHRGEEQVWDLEAPGVEFGDDLFDVVMPLWRALCELWFRGRSMPNDILA